MHPSFSFPPLPTCPSKPSLHPPMCRHHPSTATTLTRRTLISLPLLLLLPPPTPAATTTTRAFLDLNIAGRPRGTLTLTLFDTESPVAVQTFKQLLTGTYRKKTAPALSYRYSQATKISPRHFIQFGHINQTDALNQSPGTPQRQQITQRPPLHDDHNDLRHDAPGLISVRRGGGDFHFRISFAEDHALDHDYLIIGCVVDGFNLLHLLASVPTNRKTVRDGYRNVGKLIGDARANIDLEDKPLQKIQITNCGLL